MRNEKGQFEKGSGGRQQGSKNKTSNNIRAKIEGLINTNFETIEEDLNNLQPNERIKAYLKLLEFIVPKQRHIEQKIDISKLSDSEVDELFEVALNKAEWTNGKL
jgi:hypothetical protein